MSGREPSTTATTEPGLAALLMLYLATIGAVAVSGRASPWLGFDGAVALGFAAATGLVLLMARRHGLRAPTPGEWARLPVALVAAFVSLPAVLAAIALVARALDVTRGPPRPATVPTLALVLGACVLAPLYEELLYRRMLLPALQRRLGVVAALLGSSLMFALPHLQPRAILATFIVGLLLGGAWLASRSWLVCVGLHAGWNTAVLICGVPPTRLSLPRPWAALVGALLIGALLWRRTRLVGARPAEGRHA